MRNAARRHGEHKFFFRASGVPDPERGSLGVPTESNVFSVRRITGRQGSTTRARRREWLLELVGNQPLLHEVPQRMARDSGKGPLNAPRDREPGLPEPCSEPPSPV